MLHRTQKTNCIRLLLISGDRFSYMRLRPILPPGNYQFTKLREPAKAAHLIYTSPPFDLVLLDLTAGGLNAKEICNSLRQHSLPCELPILLIVSPGQENELMEALHHGANDYLITPIGKRELAARLQTQLHLRHFHHASSKFVPHEFIRALGKDNITEVGLGDFIEKEVSVLFTDIRNYTALSEQMTPEENFRFIIAYEGRMAPLIRENGGFVNQFLGDGIMALFPDRPAAGLAAAISMQRKLQQYNVSRIAKSKKPIKVGMGLHTGPLIMGIIGDEHRLQAATVADTVNTASRIEGLSKYFGANILLSENQLSHLGNNHGVLVRLLGTFQMKGKRSTTKIYECFEGDPPEMMEKKKESLPVYNRAMHWFSRKAFQKALKGWKKVLEIYPDDIAARRLLKKTLLCKEIGLQENWNGEETFLKK